MEKANKNVSLIQLHHNIVAYIAQVRVVHFFHHIRFFVKCILFKCHKYMVKPSMWQLSFGIKIVNLNKINYIIIKFNKCTPMNF
jgi:hypothetical protein